MSTRAIVSVEATIAKLEGSQITLLFKGNSLICHLIWLVGKFV
jgi:hypothetical protein